VTCAIISLTDAVHASLARSKRVKFASDLERAEAGQATIEDEHGDCPSESYNPEKDMDRRHNGNTSKVAFSSVVTSDSLTSLMARGSARQRLTCHLPSQSEGYFGEGKVGSVTTPFGVSSPKLGPSGEALLVFSSGSSTKSDDLDTPEVYGRRAQENVPVVSLKK
jgi:hypothetical protein